MNATTPIDTIIQGDCLEEMKKLPDRSIDAIVTDPPYELAFMGKKWDASGIAYNVDMWGECLRVLKPGGHLLAFGGSRTYHRMACAIEDAGFEIRDSIHWVYGSGFPKSLSIDKALDKMAGAEREVIGPSRHHSPGRKATNTLRSMNVLYRGEDDGKYDTAPATPAAKQWSGWGSALKPAHEPVVLARKPLDGCTIAENVLRWGCGGLNVDGCRIETNGEELSCSISAPFAKGLTLHKSATPGIEREGHALGRFPSNLIWSHSPLCKRIGTKKVKGGNDPRRKDGSKSGHNFHGFQDKNAHDHRPCTHSGYADENGMEEVESWDCAPDCPSWEFAKAGESKSQRSMRGLAGRHDPGQGPEHNRIKPYSNSVRGHDDEGSPARFFQACPFTEEDIPAFLYYAKASKSDRGEGNTHSTVKPTSLIRYLCKLITPPGGTILDPFGGSGTTGIAAIKEGFHYILIEQQEEYCEIARKRVAAVPARLDRWAEAAI